MIVRAGAITVAPDESSGTLTNSSLGGLSGDVSVSNDTQLGLTFAYMLQDHIGIELLAATPFTHEIKMKNSTELGGALNGKVGEVSQLPPTLSLQYFPMAPSSVVQPYLGIGINYTTFFNEDLSSQYKSLGASNLQLDDSWGLAGEVGADFMLSDNVLLNASIWYIDIDTTATMDGPLGTDKTKVDVSIDPWVYMVGLGYKF